jgi:hypothetical protein
MLGQNIELTTRKSLLVLINIITHSLSHHQLCPYQFSLLVSVHLASVVWWSEFLATDPEGPGSIPGPTRFSEKQWVWNGVH